jgi:flagellar M-ring protein FliF
VAAVGADLNRGDDVAVMVRKFDVIPIEEAPIYESAWFAMALRYGAALIAMILVLLLGIRPVVKALRRARTEADKDEEGGMEPGGDTAKPYAIDAAVLGQQVTLAQRYVAEQPENALLALRQMLQQAQPENVR